VRILLITAFVTVLIGGLCVGGGLYALNENTLDGSGTILTEGRPVTGSRAIDMEGGHYRVVVTQGSEETLTITSDDNIVDELTTEMDGDVLEIAWGDGGAFNAWRVEPTEDILLELTVTDLDRVNLSGSAELEADRLDGETFMVEIAGSGDVTLRDLRVDTLTVAIDGSGELVADGEADNQEIEIDGSGRVRAGELLGRAVRVDISSSGDVTVSAAETLDVEISGSGTVEYYGDPEITDNITGSGNLLPLGAPATTESSATPAASPAATPQPASTPRVTVSGVGTPRAARLATATATPD